MRWLLLMVLVVAACGGGAKATTAPTDPPPTATVEPTAAIGKVSFGTDYNVDTLALIGGSQRFTVATPQIAWIEELSEPAGATSLTEVFVAVNANGVERIIYSQPFTVSNPSFDTFADKGDLVLKADGQTGTYLMRVLRDATVLAEGAFILVP